ncbi:Arv1-domain-containing protein [Lindgomyces ingoldianus]|uniref:Arv1-domain-containing protein n=1 Tax=Lindgomyces ingoldianus TaxID=673940 RepID=A0ACB6R975_9PLEO|nr:Arv1-domain-containing protein [Lindgomyces ingoldianus]KAF2475809.1 Arv1-domain-containing protein [Lindgomyces ingoldianus]
MPICIECRFPVEALYTAYSKADDRSLGKGVRLTQCPRCKRFADKYVEHDFVVLFIDLVLIKPQVYRHLLFNRLGRDDDKFDRSIVRLGILLLLFDVYLTWARIEKLSLPPSSPHHVPPPSSTPTNTSLPPSSHETNTNAAVLQAQPLILQYLFFLFLVVSSTLAFHMPIRLLCSLPPTRIPRIWRGFWKRIVPYYPHPTPLSTALLVSSCTKLFPILLIIWDYDLPSSATAVSWAVIVNNVAALEILMDCGYLRAGVLVGIGAGLRSVIANFVLRAMGLGTGWGDGTAGWGDVDSLVGMVRGVDGWVRRGIENG